MPSHPVISMRLVALDLVRFFAALAVVIYHYTYRYDSDSFAKLSEFTRFGYLGVPLFFVISGYVIALSASNRTAFEFAASRFARLYPAFWCGVAFTLAIITVYAENPYSLTHILANLTMVGRYLGYENIDFVYWTLQEELKFYACVFLLLLFGVFNRFKLWLSLWLVLTATYLLTNQPYFMWWFISPTYSSYFIAGVGFFLLHQKGMSRYTAFILIASLLISGVRAFDQAGSFIKDVDLAERLVAVLLTMLIYALFYALTAGKFQLVKRNLYLTIGGMTYPLYLIHSKAGTTLIDNAFGVLAEGVAVVITILLMLLFSYLIHVGVEQRVSAKIKEASLRLLQRISLNREKTS